ncbi:MAG: Flp family type IVb pilin [Chloroflexota bacterium]
MLSSSFSKGQSVIEFAMIIVLVAIVLLIGLSLFGVSLTDTYNSIISNLP